MEIPKTIMMVESLNTCTKASEPPPLTHGVGVRHHGCMALGRGGLWSHEEGPSGSRWSEPLGVKRASARERKRESEREKHKSKRLLNSRFLLLL